MAGVTRLQIVWGKFCLNPPAQLLEQTTWLVLAEAIAECDYKADEKFSQMQ